MKVRRLPSRGRYLLLGCLIKVILLYFIFEQAPSSVTAEFSETEHPRNVNIGEFELGKKLEKLYTVTGKITSIHPYGEQVLIGNHACITALLVMPHVLVLLMLNLDKTENLTACFSENKGFQLRQLEAP